MCSLLSLGRAFSKAFISTLLWQATQILLESLIVHRPLSICTRRIKIMYIVDMDIEQFKLITVEELQSCLHLRRLRLTRKER